MRPRCANIFYSHLKRLIGLRFDIPILLIDRILLRNIPDILKVNSVLRVVRDEVSHLMPASFFPSQGHVYAILDGQTGVRQQLYPYGRRPCATNYLLALDHLMANVTRVSQVGFKDLYPERRRSAFTMARVYCIGSPRKRTNSHWTSRCIIFAWVIISTHLRRKITSGSFFLRFMRETALF